MSNAKSWLGLGTSLYFWALMDLTATVLSSTPMPEVELETLFSGRSQSHQRSKRSWVWNQFFVLEEYTGTDPLYVGKVRCAQEKEKFSGSLVLRWVLK
jgi:cadherin 20 type 2